MKENKLEKTEIKKVIIKLETLLANSGLESKSKIESMSDCFNTLRSHFVR
jgi:hypothetical protein